MCPGLFSSTTIYISMSVHDPLPSEVKVVETANSQRWYITCRGGWKRIIRDHVLWIVGPNFADAAVLISPRQQNLHNVSKLVAVPALIKIESSQMVTH